MDYQVFAELTRRFYMSLSVNVLLAMIVAVEFAIMFKNEGEKKWWLPLIPVVGEYSIFDRYYFAHNFWILLGCQAGTIFLSSLTSIFFMEAIYNDSMMAFILLTLASVGIIVLMIVMIIQMWNLNKRIIERYYGKKIAKWKKILYIILFTFIRQTILILVIKSNEIANRRREKENE